MKTFAKFFKNYRTRHAHTTTTLLCVLLSALGNLRLTALQPEANAVFVRVVDVGAGLCCVIQMPGNRFAIYDAGDGSAANGKIQELVPLGSALEMLVLSHSDSDHLGSVPFICNQSAGRAVGFVTTLTMVRCSHCHCTKNKTKKTKD